MNINKGSFKRGHQAHDASNDEVLVSQIEKELALRIRRHQKWFGSLKKDPSLNRSKSQVDHCSLMPRDFSQYKSNLGNLAESYDS